MKRMDLFCSSPASTAVTSSFVLHRSRSTKSYHHEQRKSQFHVPCSSQLPINPKPYFEKHRKSTSADNKQHKSETRRKSSVEVTDLYTQYPTTNDSSSGRYLLGDDPLIDWVSESKKITTMASSQHGAKAKPMVLTRNSSSKAHSKDQVVVLRVSLHCKACEGKVRKHISKMEGVWLCKENHQRCKTDKGIHNKVFLASLGGKWEKNNNEHERLYLPFICNRGYLFLTRVTSFNIDMVTKKVTIIGDVSPLDVVASVSKVKKAQLWQSPTSSLLSSSSTPISLWFT